MNRFPSCFKPASDSPSNSSGDTSVMYHLPPIFRRETRHLLRARVVYPRLKLGNDDMTTRVQVAESALSSMRCNPYEERRLVFRRGGCPLLSWRCTRSRSRLMAETFSMISHHRW